MFKHCTSLRECISSEFVRIRELRGATTPPGLEPGCHDQPRSQPEQPSIAPQRRQPRELPRLLSTSTQAIPRYTAASTARARSGACRLYISASRVDKSLVAIAIPILGWMLSLLNRGAMSNPGLSLKRKSDTQPRSSEQAIHIFVPNRLYEAVFRYRIETTCEPLRTH